MRGTAKHLAPGVTKNRTIFNSFYVPKKGSTPTAQEAPASPQGAVLDAVVLLNSPLNGAYDFSLYKHLRNKDWTQQGESAPYFICADGAIDFLRRMTETESDPTAAMESIWPDMLCGDMDSSTEASRCVVSTLAFKVPKVNVLESDEQFKDAVLERATESMGTTRRASCSIYVQDQDTTDFEKCIELYRVLDSFDRTRAVSSAAGEKVPSRILVLGALGGRMDHELSSINCMARNSDDLLILHNQFNTMFVCPPGSSTHFMINSTHEDTTCGLIPLGQHQTACTTTGFKWNLSTPTEELLGTTFGLGGMLSTSNEILNTTDGVTIDVGEGPGPCLLFTLAMK